MNTTLLILYLEDSLIDAELIREALANEDILCEMLHVETQMEFLTAIERQDFDLILADYSLPGFNGLSALKLAREYCPNTPFIFVTGTMGEEIAVESLKCGATDYVLKQNLARLVPVVQRALQESEDRKERKRMQEALRETTNGSRRSFKLTASQLLPLNRKAVSRSGTRLPSACLVGRKVTY